MNDSEYNYDEDYKNLHDLIFYISVVILLTGLIKRITAMIKSEVMK